MSTAQNSRLYLILVLGILSAFGPFVIDLYLPALPRLAEFFHSTTSLSQLSLTTAMIGLSVGQLFVGSLSDKFGRRGPLLVSLLIYTLSTVGLIFAPTMESFVALRLVQGLAASGSVVISRAVATDLYEGEEMKRFFGMLMTVNGVAPIISPVLGSLLLEWTSWQGIFVLLTAIGVVLMLVCLRLKESLTQEKRLTGSIAGSFRPLWTLTKHGGFMRYVSLQSLVYVGMFAYIASSPFILQEHYGLSSYAFAICFSLNGAMLVVGANVGGRMKAPHVLRFGSIGLLLASAYTGLSLVLGWGAWLTEAGFLLLLLMIGVMTPAVSALAMTEGKASAGSASALLGFLPFFAGALVSPLVGLGNIFVSTALAIVLSGVLALGLSLVALRRDHR